MPMLSEEGNLHYQHREDLEQSIKTIKKNIYPPVPEEDAKRSTDGAKEELTKLSYQSAAGSAGSSGDSEAMMVEEAVKRSMNYLGDDDQDDVKAPPTKQACEVCDSRCRSRRRSHQP